MTSEEVQQLVPHTNMKMSGYRLKLTQPNIQQQFHWQSLKMEYPVLQQGLN